MTFVKVSLGVEIFWNSWRAVIELSNVFSSISHFLYSTTNSAKMKTTTKVMQAIQVSQSKRSPLKLERVSFILQLAKKQLEYLWQA